VVALELDDSYNVMFANDASAGGVLAVDSFISKGWPETANTRALLSLGSGILKFLMIFD
jgi:hypothetical protein